MTSNELSALAKLVEGAGCNGCRFLQTFNPRTDEQKRYGFTTTGWGCKHPVDGGVYLPTIDKRRCFKGNGYSRALAKDNQHG